MQLARVQYPFSVYPQCKQHCVSSRASRMQLIDAAEVAVVKLLICIVCSSDVRMLLMLVAFAVLTKLIYSKNTCRFRLLGL